MMEIGTVPQGIFNNPDIFVPLGALHGVTKGVPEVSLARRVGFYKIKIGADLREEIISPTLRKLYEIHNLFGENYKEDKNKMDDKDYQGIKYEKDDNHDFFRHPTHVHVDIVKNTAGLPLSFQKGSHVEGPSAALENPLRGGDIPHLQEIVQGLQNGSIGRDAFADMMRKVQDYVPCLKINFWPSENDDRYSSWIRERDPKTF